MPWWEGTPHRLPQQQKHPLHLLLLLHLRLPHLHLLLHLRLPHPHPHPHLWPLLPHLHLHLWPLHLHLHPNLQFRLPLHLPLPSRWLLGRCSHRWSAA